jgi:hypothetical protein
VSANLERRPHQPLGSLNATLIVLVARLPWLVRGHLILVR